MALDPLKFAVQITDNATQELNRIKTLVEQLPDKSINVNVSGNLGEVLNLLNGGINSSSFDGIRNAISEALNSLNGINNAAKEGNFSAYAEQVNAAKAAVSGLANALQGLNAVAGENEGWQRFMAGIGEVVTRVDAAVKKLSDAAGKESEGNAFGATYKSIEKAKNELRQFDDLIKQAEASSRLGKQFGDIDTSKLDTAIERLKTYRNEIEQIKATGKSDKGRNFGAFALDAGYKEAVADVKKLSTEQHTTEMNLGRYNQMLTETNALWDRILAAWVRGSNLQVASANMQPAERQAHDFYQRLQSLNQADLNNVQIISQLAAEFQRLKGTLTATAKEQEKLNAATEKQRAKDAADAAKKAQKEDEAWAKSMRDASSEANKLGIELNRLRKIEASGSAVGVDTSKLKQYIRELETYKIILDQIAAGNRNIGHASDWIGGKSSVSGYDTYGNTSRLAKEAAGAVRELTAEKQRSTSATSQLTAEEQRLAQALNQTAESARGQSQILSDLKSMAMQYLGVWGGQQFLNNIIQIGGQLEMQRLSIGAILQNQSQANDLFEKIKGLAVQSPFGVVELDQMTKQLTAYGFKYSELFDMTKRLADISAATGTGVDRLALALGHVRSEAALSGYTLRQFSMGNVPLLQKLSEKLGKTTQEIRKMVRSKEISYEDVVGVLKDLTNEGGMFYNMQEVISQSVKARFKNVKDAMDIMYGEMAESGIGDALKGVADTLMEVTRNWKDVATVLTTGATLWATQRAAVMVYTAAIGKETTATFASISANVKKQGSMLQLANRYRMLTTAERDMLNASRANSAMIKLRTLLHMNYTKKQGEYIAAQRLIITNSLTQQLSEGKLTVAELAHMVATRKLSHEEARLIITNSALNHSEQNRAIGIINTTRQLSRLELAYRRVGMAMKSLGAMAWSFLPMAAITAMVELWQRNSRELERTKEIADSIYERSQEALKNTRTMMQETDIKTYWRRDNKSDWEDVSSNFGGQVGGERKVVLPTIDMTNAQEAIEKWTQYIRDYAATPNVILNNALFDTKENVRSLEEQFDNLKHKVVEVADAQVLLQGLGSAFEEALNKTNGGWLDDDLVTNIEDYNKSIKQFGRNVSSVYKAYRKSVDSAIKIARQQDEEFDTAVQSMGSYAQQLEYLVKNQDKYTKAVEAFKNNGGATAFGELNESGNILQNKYYKTTFDEVKEQQKTLEADMNRFFITMDEELERKGYKIGEMTVAQQQAVLLGFKTQFEGLKLSSQETLDYLMGLVSQHYGIELDVKDELFRAKVDEATRLLNGLVNGEWKVDLNFATNINDVIDKARKNYKTAKEYFENAKPIMMKFGVNASFGKEIPLMKMTEILNGIKDQGARDFVEQVMKGWNEAAKAIQQSIDASTKGGFSLEDPNKKKKEKKTGTKKSYKDSVAEEWKERIRLLKDANTLYKDWTKRHVGEEEALKHVKEQYGDIFEKWRNDQNVPWKDFNIEDIIKYRDYIQKIVDEAEARYNAQRKDKAKNYGKEAEAVMREGKKLLDDIKKFDFDETAKNFTSMATKSIEQLNKRWEIFKQTVDTTGDAMLAAQLAGFGDVDEGARTAADAMRNELIKQLEEKGGAGVAAKIKLDIDLDEEGIEDALTKAIPDADNVEEYKEAISGLIALYKEWQKLQQKANQDDISIYTKLIGMATSYAAQLNKIDKELQEQIASIGANKGLSPRQKLGGTAVANTIADWKKMKLSADYVNLHNRAVAMSAEEYERAEKAIRDLIKRLRELGLMSPEEEISETNALDKADTERRQAPKGAFGNFVVNGIQGLRDYYRMLADAAREERSRSVPHSPEWMKADKEYNDNKKKADAADDEISQIDKIIKALQNFTNAIDLVSETLTSLGGEDSALASFGNVIGGVASGAQSLAGFGMEGMIIGAFLGGANKMSAEAAKRDARNIEKLRDEIKIIEDDVNRIKVLRERELGYGDSSTLKDMSQFAKSMLDMYSKELHANVNIYNPEVDLTERTMGARSMVSYYNDLLKIGNGYEFEYNSLLKEREKYLEMLGEQMSVKHPSDAEINETKQKIAEIDEQIRYFAQDLAKELWSIDIKGWADQLSDALASAFENGENMAKAYRDTVTSIIQQMMQKMMQLSILEPMFEKLQKQIFGENGNGGVFNPNDPKGSMSKVTAMIGEFFGKGGEGEKAITASMEFMTAFQRGMQNAGLTVLNEASNTLSSSMQGTTEETSGLLAGYVNALRQDVSVNRILLTQFVSQMWPDYMETFASQVTAVQNIDTNVQTIMTMMQMGNGAMYEQIAALRTRIDNVVLGVDKFAVK